MAGGGGAGGGVGSSVVTGALSGFATAAVSSVDPSRKNCDIERELAVAINIYICACGSVKSAIET